MRTTLPRVLALSGTIEGSSRRVYSQRHGFIGIMQLRGHVKGRPREGGEIEVGWPDEGKGHKDEVGLVSKVRQLMRQFLTNHDKCLRDAKSHVCLCIHDI